MGTRTIAIEHRNGRLSSGTLRGSKIVEHGGSTGPDIDHGDRPSPGMKVHYDRTPEQVVRGREKGRK